MAGQHATPLQKEIGSADRLRYRQALVAACTAVRTNVRSKVAGPSRRFGLYHGGLDQHSDESPWLSEQPAQKVSARAHWLPCSACQALGFQGSRAVRQQAVAFWHWHCTQAKSCMLPQPLHLPQPAAEVHDARQSAAACRRSHCATLRHTARPALSVSKSWVQVQAMGSIPTVLHLHMVAARCKLLDDGCQLKVVALRAWHGDG